eukprot:c29201_g2_i1 orf=305-493(-)
MRHHQGNRGLPSGQQQRVCLLCLKAIWIVTLSCMSNRKRETNRQSRLDGVPCVKVSIKNTTK